LESATPYVYRPIEQDYSSTVIFHVRTKVPPKDVLGLLGREIQVYDASLPVFDAKTMDEQLAISVAPYGAVATALGIFGGVALLLAFAGLYGLIAYQTARRTREIGIRMALGAASWNILSLVAGQGLQLVFIGLVVGIPASMGVGLLISSFLFGVAPCDPATYIIVPALMGIVAVAAIGIPAARSVRIDPSNALRTG
jgi:ABC-type antimicrobial peptide transport system permease subunit